MAAPNTGTTPSTTIPPEKITMPTMVSVDRRIASPFVTANSDPSTAPTPYADTMIP